MQNNDDKKLDTKKVVDNKDDKKLDNKAKEKALKDFMDKMTVELLFNGLSKDLEKDVVGVKNKLESLKKEIDEKKESFINQQNSLQEKLNELVAQGALKVNKEEFERSKKSFDYYKSVLDNIGSEVNSELSFCSGLVSENPPKTIRVMKNDSQDLNVFIKSKVDWLKKYVKKVAKDLRVSYSKYNFSLESQLRNLDYLKAYLKAKAKK